MSESTPPTFRSVQEVHESDLPLTWKAAAERLLKKMNQLYPQRDNSIIFLREHPRTSAQKQVQQRDIPHPRGSIEPLAASIDDDPEGVPPVISSLDANLLDGNHREAAYEWLGLPHAGPAFVISWNWEDADEVAKAEMLTMATSYNAEHGNRLSDKEILTRVVQRLQVTPNVSSEILSKQFKVTVKVIDKARKAVDGLLRAEKLLGIDISELVRQNTIPRSTLTELAEGTSHFSDKEFSALFKLALDAKRAGQSFTQPDVALLKKMMNLAEDRLAVVQGERASRFGTIGLPRETPEEVVPEVVSPGEPEVTQSDADDEEFVEDIDPTPETPHVEPKGDDFSGGAFTTPPTQDEELTVENLIEECKDLHADIILALKDNAEQRTVFRDLLLDTLKEL